MLGRLSVAEDPALGEEGVEIIDVELEYLLTEDEHVLEHSVWRSGEGNGIGYRSRRSWRS